MSARREIKRGRDFAHSILQKDANGDPAGWPAGTFASELRKDEDVNSQLLATFTVDVTNRAAEDGGEVVLRLTDAEATAIPAGYLEGWADIRDEANTEIVRAMKFYITGVPTEAA